MDYQMDYKQERKRRQDKALNHSSIARFILRNTPLPVLIRDFLSRDDYEFVEDYRLPEKIVQSLGKNIEKALQPGAFFTSDRRAMRLGIVIQKIKSPHNSALVLPVEALNQEIKTWLLRAGRNEDEFRIFPFENSPETGGFFRDGLPLLNLLWTPDRTSLENMLGTGPRALPSDILAAYPDLPDLLDYPRRRRALTPDIEEQPLPSLLPLESTAERIPAPRASLTPTRIHTPGLAPHSNIPGTRAFGMVRYGVIGELRGRIHSKVFLKQTDQDLRLIMLASPEDKPRRDSLYFKPFGGSGDPIRAHRDLIRENPDECFAHFSLQVDENYAFRAIATGIHPLLWRAGKHNLFTFPDSRSPDQADKINILRGALGPGDRLLVLPGITSTREREEIESIILSNSPELARKKIGALLDIKSHGKALLLERAC